jgi:hypothetical protein
MIRDVKDILEKIKGVNTLESVMTLLNVNRIKAIKILSRLRKKNYVKTKRLSNNKRVYEISFENRLGGSSYIDTLNKYSPIKISGADIHRIYGKKLGPEETLIEALKSKNHRQILASLTLFKKINDWPQLYRLSKAENLEREVGALYTLSRKLMKTKKITKRFQNLSLPKKNVKYKYIIEGLNSKDFKDIESKWKVYLPFNNADLEDYASKK